jgi:hypothetical protein
VAQLFKNRLLSFGLGVRQYPRRPAVARLSRVRSFARAPGAALAIPPARAIRQAMSRAPGSTGNARANRPADARKPSAGRNADRGEPWREALPRRGDLGERLGKERKTCPMRKGANAGLLIRLRVRNRHIIVRFSPEQRAWSPAIRRPSSQRRTGLRVAGLSRTARRYTLTGRFLAGKVKFGPSLVNPSRAGRSYNSDSD